MITTRSTRVVGEIGREMSRHRHRNIRRNQPAAECLEGRQLLTITNHGGAVLSNVEVQGLYLGSDWNSSTYHSQAKTLDGFLKGIVNSSYMDMLSKAGYGVSRGTQHGGIVDSISLDSSQYLTDGEIQGEVQGGISQGALAAPNANSLYVVFVEDNIAIQDSQGETSQTNFLGYHSSFYGYDASGQDALIRYAVIAYPGGDVGNATIPWVSTTGQLTEVTSHELAEAVTDPDVGVGILTWYDDQKGENGDICVGQTVYLNGYAVQRISDLNDQGMTPAGSTARTAERFVLQTDGKLYKVTSSASTLVASGIASISDQTIDRTGNVMLDYVTTGGKAYEYHEGASAKALATGVLSAKSGDGVSYVLFTNGKLKEYNDNTNSWTTLGTNVAAIDAGTDQRGVDMVDLIATNKDAWEVSDSTGGHKIATNVISISAGRQGITDFITSDHKAYLYSEAAGQTASLGTNVAQVTAGTDAKGNGVVDMLLTNGTLMEYQVGTGWVQLKTGVKSIAKMQAGYVDMVLSNGDAYGHDSSGWHKLRSNAAAVA